MSKYYTPTIEEFHVGFEYQSLWGLEGINEEWHDEVYSEKDCVNNLCGTLRVKHLDREDIESLGFECTNDHIGFLTFKKQGCIIELAPKNPNEAPVVRITRDSSSSKFEGTIKNKSELKRILKQLGI